MTDCKSKLRFLIAEFGYAAVSTALQESMQEDYVALGILLLSGASAPTTVPEPERTPIPTPAPSTSSIQTPEPQPATQQPKPVKKAKANQQPQQQTISSLTQGTKYNIIKQDSDGNPITAAEAQQQQEKPKFATSKEAKQWQKEQEEICYARLQGQGIDPESLLTKENVSRWIEEKKTYAQIARELIGLPEYRIAEFARQNGILSEAARRRAAIVARA